LEIEKRKLKVQQITEVEIAEKRKTVSLLLTMIGGLVEEETTVVKRETSRSSIGTKGSYGKRETR
jgi:hypothetical protein